MLRGERGLPKWPSDPDHGTSATPRAGPRWIRRTNSPKIPEGPWGWTGAFRVSAIAPAASRHLPLPFDRLSSSASQPCPTPQLSPVAKVPNTVRWPMRIPAFLTRARIRWRGGAIRRLRRPLRPGHAAPTARAAAPGLLRGDGRDGLRALPGARLGAGRPLVRRAAAERHLDRAVRAGHPVVHDPALA